MPVQCTCVECGRAFVRKPSDVGPTCSVACHLAVLRRTYPATPPLVRLFRRVDYGGSGCWEWRGPPSSAGYSRIDIGQRYFGGHRVVWEALHGPLPAGVWVLHRCDNRLCVRPSHLEAGDVLKNNADMVLRGRRAKVVDYARGERHPRAKLTADEVRAIRLALAGGAVHKALARLYGVHHSLIDQIAAGRIWRSVT